MTEYQKNDSLGTKTSLNLSKEIPFILTLKKKKNQLILTKGIMRGVINLDSLALELVNQFNVEYSQVSFKYNNQNEVLLQISPPKPSQRELLRNTILEMISKELPRTLTNKVTKKPMIYVTREVIGIPLIGSLYVGIIDRGTNVLQVRSITGCPLNCPFCSVDEGPASKTKIRDYLVDPEYLAESYNFVVKTKGITNIEAHLDGQGEPMSYPYLLRLVDLLRENPATGIVSIQTNGWFLNKELIDNLAEAGLTRINLSINALEPSLAQKLAGRGDYPLKKILKLAEYIAQSTIELIITPLWVPGLNDEAISEIIKFAKKIIKTSGRFPILGIQNYLRHYQGRNIPGVRSKSFPEFNQQLRRLEEKFEIKGLVLEPEMFGSYKTEMIPNPMEVNEIVFGTVVLPGRLENEVLAIAKNRLIQVADTDNSPRGSKIKIQITRNRHNIFFGKKV
ncbi:MAG: radical SAM protein [Candidatus Heimdallarchaeota archaeon]|nr:radical SAM protein [Candidatus Heimdallarchaeota archaeon]